MFAKCLLIRNKMPIFAPKTNNITPKSRKGNKKMKKQDIFNWIETEQAWGNSVPVVINGGGFSYISPDDEVSFVNDDDYADEIEVIRKGEEFADFKSCLSDEEYESMTFVRIKHNTGYNEENQDIQVGVWELDGLLTYDVVFQSDYSSDNEGFHSSLEYCKDYIEMNNGWDQADGNFKFYKGGTVQIICNETEEVVFETTVK